MIFLRVYIGCIWIYSIYQPNYDNPLAPDYCHYVLYTFAFWWLNSLFIVSALAILAFLCIFCMPVTLMAILNPYYC